MKKLPNTKETYNQISTNFSASRNYIWPDLKPFIADVPEGASVLDLGCGNGRLLLGLPSKINYLGIDESDSLLEKAKELHPGYKFIEGDIADEKIWEKLPKYDYIFCIAVIHHLPSYHQHLFVLKQIEKHLNQNGKVLVTAWNLWQPKLLKHHIDLKTKFVNLHHLYIPFQNTPRFHFAHTLPYLKNLVKKTNLNLTVEKSTKNYLIHN